MRPRARVSASTCKVSSLGARVRKLIAPLFISTSRRMPPCSSDADEFADEREATLQALAECNNGRHFGHKHEMFMHGKLMSGPLPKPTVLWKSDKKPRKDHDTESWLTATEYEDVPAAMKAKVKQIAKLMRLRDTPSRTLVPAFPPRPSARPRSPV